MMVFLAAVVGVAGTTGVLRAADRRTDDIVRVDGLELVLTAVQGCASRFQLVPGAAMNAWADGRYVSLTTTLLDFLPDDDELAAYDEPLD